MKKIILTLLLGCLTMVVDAQEKGLYLTAGGSLGLNHFRYEIENDATSTPRIGYGGSLGIQYFFTRHWGLYTGVGLSFYNSKGTFSSSWKNNPQHYSFENMYDNGSNGTNPGEEVYTLCLGLSDWTEIQQAWFLEVPLMLMYQTKWGTSQNWGMYAGIGAKAQIPMFEEKYKVKNGSNLKVLGYYQVNGMDLVLGEPNEYPNHGFGTNSESKYEGEINLKTGFAATAELGFLFTLSRRVDLTVGGYFDYGFTDVKKNDTRNANLIEPQNGTNTIHTDNMYVGKGLAYNGYFNSYAVDKVSLMALGGKLGLRVKIGKLSKRDSLINTVEEVDEQELNYIVWVRDSLTGKPIVTQLTIVCQDCPNPDNKKFYSSEFNPVETKLHLEKTYAVSVVKAGFPAYNTTVKTTYGEKEINILAPLHPQITGTVKTPTGRVLSDVKIEVSTPEGKKYEIISDKEGKFITSPVDAGIPYTVTVSKTGYAPESITVNIPSDPSLLQPIYIAENSLGNGIQMKPIKKISLSALVLFDLDKYDLRPEAKVEIDRILPMLRENPNVTLVVGGHTDARGSAKYNQTLSQNRANSVRNYIISQGIERNRVAAKGYGFTQLLNKCKSGVKCTETEHQENRRVEFIFSETILIEK